MELEIGSPEWHQAIAKHRAQMDREEIAKLQTEGLMAQWEILQAAEEAERQAEQKTKDERTRYGDMLAEALRIKVGSRVKRNRQGGVKTFEVTRWRNYGSTSLFLEGRMIRKDGTPGEMIMDIGTVWERVKEDQQG